MRASPFLKPALSRDDKNHDRSKRVGAAILEMTFLISARSHALGRSCRRSKNSWNVDGGLIRCSKICYLSNKAFEDVII